MANIIKSIEKIPDFKNDVPGERNCMKGLSAITAGACFPDEVQPDNGSVVASESAPALFKKFLLPDFIPLTLFYLISSL